jgi:hypothetical protein
MKKVNSRPIHFASESMIMNIRHILSKIQGYGILDSFKKISGKLFLRNFPETINVEIMTICN